MQIKVLLNGLERKLEIEPHEFLLDVLRRNGVLSVKRGCNTTSCGVCTVLVDDAPVLSCAMLAAKIDGCKVVTVEGIMAEAEKFGSYLVGEGSDQCGYCNTGLVLTVIAMKREFANKGITNPTDEEISHYLAGNLCRCSGYVGQLRAVRKYLEVE